MQCLELAAATVGGVGEETMSVTITTATVDPESTSVSPAQQQTDSDLG